MENNAPFEPLLAIDNTTPPSYSRIQMHNMLSRQPLILLLSTLLLHLLFTAHARHTSNHALIVSSSRYWFNYRHANNAFLMYEKCLSYGIPKENIILMVADDYATNPRNPVKNSMLWQGQSLYNASTEIHYRGDDVTVHNVLKVLLGKGEKNVLQTNHESNVLVYWTGHGGDQFFKFQDYEEITAKDIRNVFLQMHRLQKYNELLFLVDTCQAFTLANELDDVPNVYAIGSSLKNENSYAHHSDRQLGLSVIERYTHVLIQHLDQYGLNTPLKQTMVDLMNQPQYRRVLGSTVGYKQGKDCRRDGNQIPLSDFFGRPEIQSETQLSKSSMPSSVLDAFSFSVASFNATTFVQEASSADALPPSDDDNSKTQPNQSERFHGIDPSDIQFVTLILAFVAAVVWCSERW